MAVKRPQIHFGGRLMLNNHTKPGAFGLGTVAKTFLLAVGILALTGCGVKNNNEFLDMPENIVDTSDEANDGPLGEIVDLTLNDVSVRGRPSIDKSLGYNVIRTDLNTALRGVSLSFDGGDPYGSIEAKMPTAGDPSHKTQQSEHSPKDLRHSAKEANC